MEEELKRTECLIERCKQCELNACITCDICWSEVQAIEKLLKGYRELKTENQSYRDYLGEPPCYDNASYITKSKIREEIEKLETMLQETMKGNLQKYTVEEIIYFKGFLQELLEEEV